jgi:hexulose-6-phosphate isomerase
MKSAAVVTAAATSGLSVMPSFASANASKQDVAGKMKLKKALGYGMIKEDIPLLDKFKMVKDAGFDGIEFNAPVDIPIAEFLEAKNKTGVELPSVVNKDHWPKPLSHPVPKCVRLVSIPLRNHLRKSNYKEE